MDVAPPVPEAPPVEERPPVPEHAIVMQPPPLSGAQMLQLGLQQYSPEPQVALPQGVLVPLLPPVDADLPPVELLPPVAGAPPMEFQFVNPPVA